MNDNDIDGEAFWRFADPPQADTRSQTTASPDRAFVAALAALLVAALIALGYTQFAGDGEDISVGTVSQDLQAAAGLTPNDTSAQDAVEIVAAPPELPASVFTMATPTPPPPAATATAVPQPTLEPTATPQPAPTTAPAPTAAPVDNSASAADLTSDTNSSADDAAADGSGSDNSEADGTGSDGSGSDDSGSDDTESDDGETTAGTDDGAADADGAGGDGSSDAHDDGATSGATSDDPADDDATFDSSVDYTSRDDTTSDDATGDAANGAAAGDLATIAAEMTTWINEVRAAAGVGAVTTHEGLAARTQIWSEIMGSRYGTITHCDKPCLDAPIPADCDPWAENLAQGVNLDNIKGSLLESSELAGNIRNRDYNHVGVGVAWVDDSWWVTQVFATC